MKRVLAFVLCAALSTTTFAATDPRTVPTQLPAAWQAKTREIFKQAIVQRSDGRTFAGNFGCHALRNFACGTAIDQNIDR